MSARRQTLPLPIPSWYRDHSFAGRAVLPAVEGLELLAGAARRHRPGLSLATVSEARFPRFLELPPDARELPVTVELEDEPDGRLRASLFTKRRLKTMSRLSEHCRCLLGGPAPPAPASPSLPAEPPDELSVECSRIYRELVVFGPAFHSLKGHLRLTGRKAQGTVEGRDLPGEAPLLGSPFCLDGAMHAACVHGQRRVDFIPFPVGFSARTISSPLRAGEQYRVEAVLRSRTENELLYDLTLHDADGTLCEQVTGLQMRDVSGGRLKPPAWIRREALR